MLFPISEGLENSLHCRRHSVRFIILQISITFMCGFNAVFYLLGWSCEVGSGQRGGLSAAAPSVLPSSCPSPRLCVFKFGQHFALV